VFVLGAGCSHEDPIGLPLSRQLARACHDQLVANGVLQADACDQPEDLSAGADSVVVASGGFQRPFELTMREVDRDRDPVRLVA
jgi:hypothetical protein